MLTPDVCMMHLSYDVETFELKLNDANGSPTTMMGKYVVVWKKQPDGHWKAAADIFNSDKQRGFSGRASN